MTLLQKLDRVPPVLCRMLAVKLWRGRPKRIRRSCVELRRITVDELVEKSGLSRRNFVRISTLGSWKDVKLGVVDAFSRACEVDLLSKNPMEDFMKRKYRPGLPYFTKAQRKVFDNFLNGK